MHQGTFPVLEVLQRGLSTGLFPDIMDHFLAGGDQLQTNQPNNQACRSP